MVDYSQFEASTKSGIHADVNRIRQKDEIIRAVVVVSKPITVKEAKKE